MRADKFFTIKMAMLKHTYMKKLYQEKAGNYALLKKAIHERDRYLHRTGCDVYKANRFIVAQ